MRLPQNLTVLSFKSQSASELLTLLWRRISGNVSDIEKSLKFYRDILGHKSQRGFSSGNTQSPWQPQLVYSLSSRVSGGRLRVSFRNPVVSKSCAWVVHGLAKIVFIRFGNNDWFILRAGKVNKKTKSGRAVVSSILYYILYLGPRGVLFIRAAYGSIMVIVLIGSTCLRDRGRHVAGTTQL